MCLAINIQKMVQSASCGERGRQFDAFPRRLHLFFCVPSHCSLGTKWTSVKFQSNCIGVTSTPRPLQLLPKISNDFVAAFEGQVLLFFVLFGVWHQN